MATSPDKRSSSWREWTSGFARRPPDEPYGAPSTLDDDDFFAKLADDDGFEPALGDEPTSEGELDLEEDDAETDAEMDDADDEFGVRLRWPSDSATNTTPRAAPFGAVADLAPTFEPTERGDAPPVPLLPVLARRLETLQATVESLSSGLDLLVASEAANRSAVVAAVDRLTARLDVLDGVQAAAIDRIAVRLDALESGLASVQASVVGSVGSIVVAVETLIGDVADLSDELGRLRRRLPVRAKQDAVDVQQVAAMVSEVRRALGREPLGDQIADVVVARLLDVVDVVEPAPVVEAEPAVEAEPVVEPAAAEFDDAPAPKRRRRQPLAGRGRT
jgi:hypothetical protein